MPDLERELRALAGALEYPPTPDLATRVGARLEADRRAPSRPPLGRVLAIAAAALALSAAAGLAAGREAADALLDAFGLGSVEIERTTAPPPQPVPRDLGLGPSAPLDRAAKELAFEPLLPAVPGPVDAHVVSAPGGGVLSLVYDPRPGLPPTITTRTGMLVTEFRGDLVPGYLRKVAPQATTVERLRVDGHRAIWIAGAPHYFLFRAPGGEIAERDLQVAQNVLLIERGPVLVRMEGAFDRDTAVRLAGTLRPLGL
jgi:hypothetical protein